MKKVSKIITLILVVALLCTVLSGCAMFGRNAKNYRATVMANIGSQTITVGSVLDAFNTQYNNYYYYIANGYFTAEQVFEIAVSSLYEQAIKVDAYVSNNDAVTTNTTYANGEYLTADELNFVVTYVKYLIFDNFDSQVESYLSADFEFEAVEEEDTSRDFLEPDEIDGQTYADYVYSQNYVNEEMSDYLKDYYGITDTTTLSGDTKIDSYVFATEEAAKATLDDYNDRLDDDATKLDFATLKANQEKVLKYYGKTIKNSYGIEIEDFIVEQIESMIKSIIVAKYNYNLYKEIQGANKDKTIAALIANADGLKANQSADYILNNNFDSFITALSDTSYIYAVDDTMVQDYIFVKNILVPFTDEQTQYLSNLAQTLGSTESDEYLTAREQLAAEIIADDFTSDKNDDGEYTTKVEGLFKYENGKLAVDTTNSAWGGLLNADGSVAGDDLSAKTANIVGLMKKFNTDTAQHSKVYDYVVRVGNDDHYTQPWVTEFVTAAKEAKALGVGSYSICVSSYGIHIVYYSDDVTVQNFDQSTFDDVLGELDTNLTTTPAYKVFKAYFESQSSTIVNDDLKELRETYYSLYEEGKISATKEFAKFIKDNGLEYTFEDMIAVEEDD